MDVNIPQQDLQAIMDAVKNISDLNSLELGFPDQLRNTIYNNDIEGFSILLAGMEDMVQIKNILYLVINEQRVELVLECMKRIDTLNLTDKISVLMLIIKNDNLKIFKILPELGLSLTEDDSDVLAACIQYDCPQIINYLLNHDFARFSNIVLKQIYQINNALSPLIEYHNFYMDPAKTFNKKLILNIIYENYTELDYNYVKFILYICIRSGLSDLTNKYLEKLSSINEDDATTLIEIAVSKGNISLAKLLLNKYESSGVIYDFVLEKLLGSCVNSHDYDNRIELIDYVIERGGKIEADNINDHTIRFAITGDLRLIDYFLKFGVKREKILTLAIKFHVKNVVIDQLRHGANLECKDAELISFLSVIYSQDPDVVLNMAKEFDFISSDIFMKAILVPDIHRVSFKYMECLSIIDKGRDDISYFIERNADIRLIESYIVNIGSVESLMQLEKFGLDLHVNDNALFKTAAKSWSVLKCKFLLSRGCNISDLTDPNSIEFINWLTDCIDKNKEPFIADFWTLKAIKTEDEIIS